MPSPPPVGARDGTFVVFKGWDIPSVDPLISSYNIAYYPSLSGKIADLKNKALGTIGDLVNAFTSTGYLKVCPARDWQSWKSTPGTDLYIRVEYPGWVFVPGQYLRHHYIFIY